MLKKGKFDELQKIVNTTNQISLPVIALIFIIIVVFSDFLLSQFGPMYPKVQIPLIILSVGYLAGATSLANARIIMFISSKKILLINITEVAFLVVFGVVLTYFYGIIGMSFSVLISNTLKAAIMYYYVKKETPLKPFGFF